MFEDKKELIKLSQDLYNNNKLQFNNVSGDVAIRRLINEKLGQEPDATSIDRYAWEKNKIEVFELLSVAVDAVLPVSIKNQFDSLADVRNVVIGDKPVFNIEDPSLFRVGMIASGTTDLRRQELFGSSFTVDTDYYGAKTFVELERLLAGNVNWQTFINKLAESFTQKMGQQIVDGFLKSYDVIKANRKFTGAYSEDKLIEVAQHVSTQSGGKGVAVYGSASALRKVSKGVQMSDEMKNQLNRVGYLGNVAGLDLVQLPNVYRAVGKEEFVLDDNTLLILPSGEKIISIVLEGDTYIEETKEDTRNDLQKEFLTSKKYGLQVAKLSVFGMYKINA